MIKANPPDGLERAKIIRNALNEPPKGKHDVLRIRSAILQATEKTPINGREACDLLAPTNVNHIHINIDGIRQLADALESDINNPRHHCIIFNGKKLEYDLGL